MTRCLTCLPSLYLLILILQRTTDLLKLVPYNATTSTHSLKWSHSGPGRYIYANSPTIIVYKTNKQQGEDTSPASFEKTLSTLSTKATETNTQLDKLRQQARRFKALWTLYSVFIYLLYSTIDVLVLGWQNWGYWEWGAVLGGPFVFVFRTAEGYYYSISDKGQYIHRSNRRKPDIRLPYKPVSKLSRQSEQTTRRDD